MLCRGDEALCDLYKNGVKQYSKLYKSHKKCGAGRPSMTNSLGWEMAVILVRVLCSLHNI